MELSWRKEDKETVHQTCCGPRKEVLDESIGNKTRTNLIFSWCQRSCPQPIWASCRLCFTLRQYLFRFRTLKAFEGNGKATVNCRKTRVHEQPHMASQSPQILGDEWSILKDFLSGSCLLQNGWLKPQWAWSIGSGFQILFIFAWEVNLKQWCCLSKETFSPFVFCSQASVSGNCLLGKQRLSAFQAWIRFLHQTLIKTKSQPRK